MTSYSTLVRKAKAAKTKTARDKLMKQANAVRRKNRKAGKKLLEAVGEAGNKARDPLAGIDGQGRKATENRGAPGHGEIVGGEKAANHPVVNDVDNRFNDLKAAIKAGNDAEAVNIMRSIGFNAETHGRVSMGKDIQKRVETVAQSYQERVVAGFIAEIEDSMPIEPRMVLGFNGFTLCRVVDALRNGGWSAHGLVKTGR